MLKKITYHCVILKKNNEGNHMLRSPNDKIYFNHNDIFIGISTEKYWQDLSELQSNAYQALIDETYQKQYE